MEYGDISLNEINTLIHQLNGNSGVRAVLKSREVITTKYGANTLGQIEALLNKIGEENIALLLSGDFQADITKVLRPLFNNEGLRIKPKDLKSLVSEPNFRCKYNEPGQPILHLNIKSQPVINYGERYNLGFEQTGLFSFVSVQNFAKISDLLIEEIKSDKELSNLLKGMCLPIIIPKNHLTDPGEITDELLKIVAKTCKIRCPQHRFSISNGGIMEELKLKGDISIVDGSHYNHLMEKMKKTSIVALYFPQALAGYSYEACIEQMKGLPQNVILSGSIDATIASAMYPDVLFGNVATPNVRCPAMRYEAEWTKEKEPDYSVEFSNNSCGTSFSFDFFEKPETYSDYGYCYNGLLYISK